jgi:1-acyl-sn-glycerol-3-phosphate acyltransferase
MTFNQLKAAIYATYLTNLYGFKCKFAKNNEEVLQIRDIYANRLMNYLGLSVKVLNPEKIPQEKCVLIMNHRSTIDPLIADIAVEETGLFGLWIAKKELYRSFFFGVFVRNAGTILIDRESSQMGGFFKEVKDAVSKGGSIYIFPEGTRNKTDKNLTEFKEGAKLIAIKSRLPIIPMHIKTNANKALKDSLVGGVKHATIEVVFGDPIDLKDKSLSLEENYRKQFNIID